MTDYQMDLVIDTYFNTLMDEGISEDNVKDMFQKNGVLHIVLKDEKIIKKQIKNFK